MQKIVSLKYCTELTDVSFLSQCKNLKELNLKGCTNLSQEHVDSLREKLPDCNIDY